MNTSFNCPDDFRIEISGWGLDNCFFAERTDLLWAADGKRHVQLHRALPVGAIDFIRLLSPEPSSGSVPVAYRVQDVVPMDCNGCCQMRLEQSRSRSKESSGWKNASNVSEDSEKECDVREFESELKHQEILQ